jgi:release factor glutamine methyltransferase
MLAHVLGCSRIDLYVRNAEEPGEDDRARYRELIRRRAEGTPVSRLLGKAEFFSLELELTPDVLDPRPDTGWLVTEALGLIKPLSSPRVLDVGTGSGCVAIAVAKGHPEASVTAIDVSPPALAAAARNVERHGLAGRVQLLEGDLFAPLGPDDGFHVIVSNPPYIPTHEIPELDPEVRDHDPHLALDGGPDGFAVIERILAGASRHLRPGGHLLCEIGHDQAAEARRRFASAGWQVQRIVPDDAGHLRVVVAQWGGR